MSRTLSFHMWMIGRDASSARPTIVFTSRSSRLRSKAKRFVEEDGMMADLPAIELKGLDKMPAVPRGANHSTELRDDEIESSVYLLGTPRSLCGAPILLGHSNRATLGGTILIDGVYHGITVLHPRLDKAEEFEDVAEKEGSLAFDEDIDEILSDCHIEEATSRGQALISLPFVMLGHS